MLHLIIEKACKVLQGEEITRSEALEIAHEIHGEDLLDLVSLANKVRKRFAEPIVPCSILNVKSGVCSQNCKFCSQSLYYNTGIETYPLLSTKKVLAAARNVYENGIRIFGYVTSGYGYKSVTEEFQSILDTIDIIHQELPDLKICMCTGILSRETAKLLAEHHVWRYNMNLQTNPKRYRELIADTHTIEEKIQTIKYLQEFGVTNCTGGILGLGETWEDRIEMAFTIRELNVEGCPLNVLLPIKGTPLGEQEVMRPAEAAKTFAIFRLINPTKMIKFAAGRETVMKDFQGLLMLSGLNSIITGGYLTTRGRSIDDDCSFLNLLEDF